MIFDNIVVKTLTYFNIIIVGILKIKCIFVLSITNKIYKL